MDRRQNAVAGPEESIAAAPERVTRLLAGNRSPGVEARLMFPGWGPKLWERPATLREEPDEQRYGA